MTDKNKLVCLLSKICPIPYREISKVADCLVKNGYTIATDNNVGGKRYNSHEVAEIIADLFGDSCACNFNGIDEWLPEHCELLDACPEPVGVACWEQYLKFLNHKEVSND